MARSVTLIDVARHAGVSRSTASYVVTGTGRVSEETRERVRASMRELGYIYHQAAASLRRQGTRGIGVVVTNIDRPFFGEVLIGLESTLTEHGFMSLVASTRDDYERQTHVVRMLREHHVAALRGDPGELHVALEQHQDAVAALPGVGERPAAREATDDGAATQLALVLLAEGVQERRRERRG